MLSNTFVVLDTKIQPLQILTKQSITLKTNVNFYEIAAQEFRKAYRLTPGLTPSSLQLQQNLIDEEHLEVAHAYLDLAEDPDNKVLRAHLLKELADLVYVCNQMAAAFGWNLQVAHNRVHATNMSKLDEDGNPIYREDGKILKGPNYFEPYLLDLVWLTMATIQQLIKVISDIDKAKLRYTELLQKRNQLADELELNKPIGYYAGKAETIFTVNDKQMQVWAHSDGRIEIEELTTN